MASDLYLNSMLCEHTCWCFLKIVSDTAVQTLNVCVCLALQDDALYQVCNAFKRDVWLLQVFREQVNKGQSMSAQPSSRQDMQTHSSAASLALLRQVQQQPQAEPTYMSFTAVDWL